MGPDKVNIPGPGLQEKRKGTERRRDGGWGVWSGEEEKDTEGGQPSTSQEERKPSPEPDCAGTLIWVFQPLEQCLLFKPPRLW